MNYSYRIISNFLSLILTLLLRFSSKYQKLKSIVERKIVASQPRLQDQVPLPIELLNLVILVEDRRFFLHKGIDVIGICRAMKNNIIKGSLEGASTIEQQIVRFVTNERSITHKRKLQEWIIAAAISQQFSKRQLLEFYCIFYPFYSKISGFPELCKAEKLPLDRLSKKELCSLVGRLKYPSIYKGNHLRFKRHTYRIEYKYGQITNHASSKAEKHITNILQTVIDGVPFRRF